MTYLIDTCIMSEFFKKVPNPQVSQWFNQQSIEQLFLSSVTIAEIKKGIYKIQNSQMERYQKLKIWLQKVEREFSSQILPINDEILDSWAKFSANAELQGKKLAVMDSLIAATAHHHQLILVTRNVDDFQMTPVKIINPF
ncbi:type II toxin-antitoxin system VapC family toxin [Anabaenopsis tanganyikae CS-531]|uniref:Type II toxin-antitoxin system VapC family toxin n=1 Tax=Anabaenopsis tanganyikae CS-531 TaxID=2785304 RepID=A0ABT6KDR6_9CYAN|nr:MULTISPECIES: type II toxin-antitoxin system VapC family toxin [Anabaenopsis]MDH6099365.1 type II toxin-antitoxin system VapC family toxin [Anabaenopsis sp. FSS-46]MDH6106005.1 type II toxin-antitoxin system VapC family toxin [Anabaenopsis tanganyikae CS-531]